MSKFSILPPSEVALFRSLRKTAIVLLLMFRLDQLGRSPVLISELAQLLDMQRETVADHLTNLSLLNLVARAGYHDGYLLTQGGRQWVLGSPAELLPGLSPESIPNERMAENPSLQWRKIRRSSATAVKAVEGVNSSLERALITTTVLSDEMAENPPLALEKRMITILEQTLVLWRDPILSQGLPGRDEQMVLAWIAQAWDQRDKLNFPQGMAYQSLKRGRRPLARYRDHPERYLPADFFEGIDREDLARYAQPVS